MRRMLRALLISGLLLWIGTATPLAIAQEDPKPDQLKKLYDDALNQLRQAQDRKNELAAENEKLNAKLGDLQKQLDTSHADNDRLKRDAADFAEKTFFLRSQYAAWREFLQRYPKLQAQWDVFLRGDAFSPAPLPQIIDKDWPLSAAG